MRSRDWAVAVAVDATFHGLRYDLDVGIDLGGVVDHARDQQRPVHHHPAQHGRILLVCFVPEE